MLKQYPDDTREKNVYVQAFGFYSPHIAADLARHVVLYWFNEGGSEANLATEILQLTGGCGSWTFQHTVKRRNAVFRA